MLLYTLHLGNTEFNAEGNPGMDWHLIRAIKTEIFSDGSMERLA